MSQEFLEIDSKINKILECIELLVPNEFSLSYIAHFTHAKRETIYKYLQRNYIENLDYWLKNGKIFIGREVGLELIRRYRHD